MKYIYIINYKGIPLFTASFHLWSHHLQIFSSQPGSNINHIEVFGQKKRKVIDFDLHSQNDADPMQ